MLVRSYPTGPNAIAILGDFAVQQNSSNRSQSMLNDVMDGTFKPANTTWQALWVTQQQAESAVGQLVVERDAAERDFRGGVYQVYYALVYSLGKDSAVIQQYIPGGNLEVNSLPLDKELTAFKAYAPVIAQAPEAQISPDLKQLFNARYQAGLSVQARLKAAEQAARDAQRTRAAQDAPWLTAYKAYHRAVEFVAEGDRGVIQTWIRLWPEECAPQTEQSAAEKAAQREANAKLKAAAAVAKAEAAAMRAEVLAGIAAARAARAAARGAKAKEAAQRLAEGTKAQTGERASRSSKAGNGAETGPEVAPVKPTAPTAPRAEIAGAEASI